jgi:hypothetical protein
MTGHPQDSPPVRGSMLRAMVAGILAAAGVVFGVSVADLTDRAHSAAAPGVRVLSPQSEVPTATEQASGTGDET